MKPIRASASGAPLFTEILEISIYSKTQKNFTFKASALLSFLATRCVVKREQERTKATQLNLYLGWAPRIMSPHSISHNEPTIFNPAFV